MNNEETSSNNQELISLIQENLLTYLSREELPNGKEILWEYITANFQAQIPRIRICKEHVAPFDFVYDAFTGKHKTIIAKSNRSGGKTTDLAVLDILHSLANFGCEIASLGAIKAQSQRCYRYMQSFTNANPDFTARVRNSIMSRTDFDTGSSVEILTATLSGVNSPHPQKLFMDEVDLIAWFIIQQAFNMPKSKGDIAGQTILTSTQHFVGGPMDRLLENAKTKGRIGVYEWCIWEVMRKPEANMIEYYKSVFKDYIPEGFENADGYYSWDDLLEEFDRNDSEVFETEVLCMRPQSGGLVYPRFTDDNNLEKSFILDKSKVYVFEDYGYALTHPDCIVLAQVDLKMQKVIIFDELQLSLMNTSEILSSVDSLLEKYGLNRRTIQGWVGDPHGLTETKDRYNEGCPMISFETLQAEYPELKVSELLRVRNGIAMVRKFIDERWLTFTPNCTMFRAMMMSYRKVKNPDGTYKDDPEKKNDHFSDGTRYGLIRLFPIMGFASFDVVRARATVPDSIQPAQRPITAGLLSKVF